MIQQVNGWFYPQNTVSDLKALLMKIVRDREQSARLPFDNGKTRLPSAEAEEIAGIYQMLVPSLSVGATY